MALQDLTPQLRTRLNRMERAVGWFVIFATFLLLFGFGYYTYTTAEQKGWFKAKAVYYMYADSGTGLSVGDPVTLMGFQAGHIRDIQPMPARGPGSEHNVYVEFDIVEPHFGYLWLGSQARLMTAGFLGKRQLEVTRATNGYSTYISYPTRSVDLAEVRRLPNLDKLHLGQEIYEGTNLLNKAWITLSTNLDTVIPNAEKAGLKSIMVIDNSIKKTSITAMWNQWKHRYDIYKKNAKMKYEMPTYEEPSINDRLQVMVSQVEKALPQFLSITNQINNILTNTTHLTSNLNVTVEKARPLVDHLGVISGNLTNSKGALGEWLIPTNINAQLESTLLNANVVITNANTNLAILAQQITLSLENLANITSNLNAQVQSNSNIVTQVSDIVVHTDQFVQGLKRHWLLRSAFKTPKTNTPPAVIKAPSPGNGPLRSPKDQNQ